MQHVVRIDPRAAALHGAIRSPHIMREDRAACSPAGEARLMLLLRPFETGGLYQVPPVAAVARARLPDALAKANPLQCTAFLRVYRAALHSIESSPSVEHSRPRNILPLVLGCAVARWHSCRTRRARRAAAFRAPAADDECVADAGCVARSGSGRCGLRGRAGFFHWVAHCLRHCSRYRRRGWHPHRWRRHAARAGAGERRSPCARVSRRAHG